MRIGTLLSVEALTPPIPITDASRQNEEEDDAALDANFVASCLALEDPAPPPRERDVEIVGHLLSWWRLVRRCLAVTRVFDQLHKAGGKRKGTRSNARDRYKMFLKKTLGAKDAAQCVSYAQATRLDRLGRLLHEFPVLVFQVQFVSVRDWYEQQSIAKKGSAPLVSCWSLIVEENEDFWRRVPELGGVASGKDILPSLPFVGPE